MRVLRQSRLDIQPEYALAQPVWRALYLDVFDEPAIQLTNSTQHGNWQAGEAILLKTN
jgi:hypothetical protein